MANVSARLRRLRQILFHPANRGHWLRAATRTASFRKAVARNAPVDLPYGLGTYIRCWPDSNVARSIAYFGGLYDHNEMSFLVSYLRPGDAVLDAGANIGSYSILAAALVGARGLVVAIEPIEGTASRLRENIALNGFQSRIQVHQVAVGEVAGCADMTIGLDSVNRVLTHDEGTGMRVQVRTLDDIVGSRQLAFAKLDVEGMEWNALRGAKAMLGRRSPPIWMVEINGAHFRYGHRTEAFLAWMRESGFAPAQYSARRNALRLCQDPWDDVLFVATECLPSVVARIPGLRVEQFR